ncbi:MAG: HlyD family efflux transporter periplasmic adaptor subunit, partial [Planctomycetales bacterium]|nr:HlyD family efflux transporter periplasmic adaptor subunit [Planctomycetales bacterium]
QSVKIEEGATVREGQTLIRLPDLGNMQVKVIVHESKVELIKRGMAGRIKIGDRQLDGTVVFVANQPEPASWMNANVKEYATTVKIEGEMSGLKPGMTAEVEILIEDLNDVPLIPVSAVVEQRGKFYTWVKTAGAPERRQLTLGRTNDKMIHVVDGVKQGDEVLLNPRAVVSDARDESSESDERTDDRFKKADGSQTKGDAKANQPDASSGKKAGDTAEGAASPGSSGESGDETAKKSAKRPQFNIMSLDKDGDKKVSRDEASGEGAPPFMASAFDFMDTNKDGFIDAAEVAESRKRMQQGGGGRPGGPGGGPPGGAP